MSGGKQKRIQREAAVHRDLAAASAAVKAEQDAKWAESRARKQAMLAEFAAMPAVDPTQILPGMVVADRRGRADVVERVNEKTVTLKNTTTRWPLESIIAARFAAQTVPAVRR